MTSTNWAGTGEAASEPEDTDTPDATPRGRFRPGDPRINRKGRPPNQSLTALAREASSNGVSIVAFYQAVLDGKVPRASVKDRLAAGDWLAVRGYGRPADVRFNADLDASAIEGAADRLSGLSLGDLQALARNALPSNLDGPGPFLDASTDEGEEL